MGDTSALLDDAVCFAGGGLSLCPKRGAQRYAECIPAALEDMRMLAAFTHPAHLLRTDSCGVLVCRPCLFSNTRDTHASRSKKWIVARILGSIYPDFRCIPSLTPSHRQAAEAAIGGGIAVRQLASFLCELLAPKGASF